MQQGKCLPAQVAAGRGNTRDSHAQCSSATCGLLGAQAGDCVADNIYWWFLRRSLSVAGPNPALLGLGLCIIAWCALAYCESLHLVRVAEHQQITGTVQS